MSLVRERERPCGDARLLVLSALTAILILSLIGFQISLVRAAELHVGPDQTYATIQAAVNAASPGDTIIVHAGTYRELLTINKGITLKAALGEARPIIDGDTNNDGTPDGHCISISADGVKIMGFEIRNGYNGIYGRTSNSVIEDNIIHDHQNYVSSNGVGILLWGDNDNNQILNNEIYSNDRQGIFIGYSDSSKISSGNIISGNKIHNNGLYRQPNGPDASAYGIQLWNADGNTIKNNEVYGHDEWFPSPGFDFAQGIYLCASFHNTVVGNNLHDNNYGVGFYRAGRTIPTPDNNKINFNNIAGNTGYGVRNHDTVQRNAKYNWWGSPTGPTHSSNPGGTGDKVSDNVDFTPWLLAPTSGGKSQTITGSGSVDAKDEADTEVDISAKGDHTITCVKYTSNPGGPPTFTAVGLYYDVSIDSVAGVDSVTVRFYYTDADIAGFVESSLRAYWWTGTTWTLCNPQTLHTEAVDGYSGYIEVGPILATGTTPTLSQLVGTPFAFGGETPAPPPPKVMPPVGGEVYSSDKLAILAPYIALIGLASVVAVAVKRRKT